MLADASSAIALHSAFAEWRTLHQRRFPFAIERCVLREHGFEIYLSELNSAIHLSVTPHDACIAFSHRGVIWDLLFAAELDPQQQGGYWFCGACAHQHEKAADFPSLKALWEHHIFEPIASAVGELLEAETIGLYELNGAATWARPFSREQTIDTEHLVIVLPVRCT